MIGLRDLRLHLKVDPDQTTDDTLIVEMEQAAVAYLQNQTGRHFGGQGEITEVLSSNGWASIWLQAAPEIDDDYLPFLLERRTTPSGEWEVVPATEYEVDGYRLYPLAYWTPGRRTLRATYYSAGYSEGAEPADIQEAIRRLVTKLYTKRAPTVGEADIDDFVRSTIMAHRVVVV